MTGRPLHITQRQVEAIAKGAVKAGCRVEIKIGDVVVTLIPDGLQPLNQAMPMYSGLITREEDINL